MKHIYLFAMMVAFGTAGFAQSFTISPNPLAQLWIAEGASGDASIYFQNQTSGDLTLVWELSANSLDSDWFVTICDNGQCFTGPYPGSTMMPIASGSNAFLKFTCDIGIGEYGSGQLSYDVWVDGDPSTAVEITFDVNSVVSITPSLAANLSIFPNPTTDVLTLRANSSQLEDGQAQVYDLSGRLLREVPVSGVEAVDIDVRTLSEGAYLLRYTSEKGVVTRRFLKTN